jgi:hypothetical protein
MDNRRPTTKIQKKSKNIFTQNILVGGGAAASFLLLDVVVGFLRVSFFVCVQSRPHSAWLNNI